MSDSDLLKIESPANHKSKEFIESSSPEGLFERSEEISRTASEESIRLTQSEDEDEDVVRTVGSIQLILTDKIDAKGEHLYFVKYFGLSYRKCGWVKARDVPFPHTIKQFEKRGIHLPAETCFNPNYTKPEKILTTRVNQDGEKEYLVKWYDLDYDELTWESSKDLENDDLILNFEKSNQIPKDYHQVPERPSASEWRPIHDREVNESKDGKKIRSYQLEGLNFLMNSWFNKRNAILADEMGLGKTMQSIMFLQQLHVRQHLRGPFMIVGPLSTLVQWEREVRNWTDMSVLSYCGTQIKRNMMKEHEMFYPGTTYPKFNVLLTTYEYAVKDSALFHTIKWQCIVVDEAHRLKNNQSKLFTALTSLDCGFKVLLTGTPLQNNIGELWSLLNFLDNENFSNIVEFEEKFGCVSEAEKIKDLQTILRPLMLRRLKNDVEKTISPLQEIIIECAMSQHQKGYYQSIFNKNREYLSRGEHKTSHVNINNIFMELRKVCNHPYLVNGAEKQILVERREMMGIKHDPPDFVEESLIRTSGKMILLDKLLAKLKADGHRVLLFSQMTHMLDIIEDYLKYKNYQFQRLDGHVRGSDRQKAIDSFNAKDSSDFIFLLCTKAGGVGINLTSADVVIIYDSDWNPQNDIQATARCHRIGQTKQVKMYRLLTAKSYERTMFDRASMKLGLDSAVLESGRKHQNPDELEKILRMGAYYAFQDDAGEAEKFGEEDIESILSRAQTISHENVVSGDGSTFSKLQFEIQEDDVDLSAKDFWQRYVQESDDDTDTFSIAERLKQRRGQQYLDGKASKQARKRKKGSKDIVTDKQQKEFVENMLYEEHDCFQGNEDFEWNSGKIIVIMNLLLKFGWGRWVTIRQKSEFDCTPVQLQCICHCIVQNLFEASSEKFPVVESIFKESKSPDAAWEARFANIHKRAIETIRQSANWKLGRLDLLYFLNSVVMGCPNPPDSIVIPQIVTRSPPEWWTARDDRRLLYGIWQDGFLEFGGIKFTEPIEANDKTFLVRRSQSLISGIKQAYLKFKENHEDIDITYDNLVEALSTWTLAEQRVVTSCLCMYGNPDVEKLFDIAGLTEKTIDQFEDFLYTVIAASKKMIQGKSYKDGMLPERITMKSARRIMSRIKLFEAVRAVKNYSEFSDDDKYFIKYAKKYGVMNIPSDARLSKRFDCENYENDAIKVLKELVGFQEDELGEARGRSAVPVKVELPLHIGATLVINKIGTCVYDRPAFHNERYIYPAGFESMKLFTSIVNPSEKVWYKSSIIDNGGDEPIFRVEIPDTQYVFEGTSASKPWMEIMREIHLSKKRLNLPPKKTIAVSGPEFFGIAAQQVLAIMNQLPGAGKCSRFVGKSVSCDNEETPTRPRKSNHEPENETKPPPAEPPSPVRVSEKKQKKKRHQEEETELSPPVVTPPDIVRVVPHRFSRTRELVFDFGAIWQSSKEKSIAQMDTFDEDTSTMSVSTSWLVTDFQSKHIVPHHPTDPLRYILDYTKQNFN